MKRVFNAGVLLIFVFTFTLGAVSKTAQALAASGDRFRPSSPTDAGQPEDSLRTAADFEAAVAAKPVSQNEILVSRCRFAPFNNSTSFYSSFSAGVADAIVGDTTFAFADGTQCYNPQNESNIVVNMPFMTWKGGQR